MELDLESWRGMSDLADLPKGRLTWTSPAEDVRAVLDSNNEEWFMEASPFATDSVRACLTKLMFPLGLEPLSEDECEPETTDEGWTRIYFAATVAPVIPDALEVAA